MAKQINTRIQQKYDTRANWTTAGENGFKPLAGEVIIYSDGSKDGDTAPAMKIGDGVTTVDKLEFVSSGSDANSASDIKLKIRLGIYGYTGTEEYEEGIFKYCDIPTAAKKLINFEYSSEYNEYDPSKEEWVSVNPIENFSVLVQQPSQGDKTALYDVVTSSNSRKYVETTCSGFSLYDVPYTYTFHANIGTIYGNSWTLQNTDTMTSDGHGGYYHSTWEDGNSYGDSRYYTQLKLEPSTYTINGLLKNWNGTSDSSNFSLNIVNVNFVVSKNSDNQQIGKLVIYFTGEQNYHEYITKTALFEGQLTFDVNYPNGIVNLTTHDSTTKVDWNQVTTTISSLFKFSIDHETNTYILSIPDMYRVYVTRAGIVQVQSYEYYYAGDPCLLEGTLITMADGSQKPIEDVNSGDLIMSYDPNTKQNVDAIVVSAYKTGVANKFDVYTFSDGNVLSVYGEHGAYNDETGHPFKLLDITRKHVLLNSSGERVKWTQTTYRSYHGYPKKRYNLVSSNNLYYANNILLGNSAFVKLEYLIRRGMDKRIPEDILKSWIADADQYNDYSSFKNDPEFNREAKDLLAKKAMANSVIKNNKARLEKSDYKVQKYTEGKMSNEEFEKSKNDRDVYRKRINAQENILSENIKSYEELVNKYRKGATYRSIFEDCCKRDNALLETIKNYVAENGSFIPKLN